MALSSQARPVGELLRGWRRQRRRSQLDLALDAEVSARHISFLETGRSLPSREMVLRLAEQLEVPLRERNQLLTAAGYAPVYSAHTLDEPSMRAACAAIEQVLRGHEPYPALAVDRHWTLVSANRALAPLLAGVAPELLTPPVNVLRVSLHPDGLARRIANLAQWRAHVLERLQRQAEATADPALAALLEELRGYAARAAPAPRDGQPTPEVFVPLRLQTDAGLLAFVSTITVFGAPHDVTLDELAIEAFFPADDATAEALRALSTT
jgi:transcriptional regulator with XRE-family HTH domain